MSFPLFPSLTPTISLSLAQTTPLLLGTIAVEELAIAHLINAEAEKTQFVLGTLTPTTVSLSVGGSSTTPLVAIHDLLNVNRSVRRTLQDVIKKEMLLQFKFDHVFDLLAATAASTFTFNFTGALQTVRVPSFVNRARILAIGAGGGNSFGQVPGKGASIQGDFPVTPGEILSILVGGRGGNGGSASGGGGGGGSFVWRGSGFAFLSPATLLVAAGGGGGAGGGVVNPGVDAQISQNGTSGNPGGAGGMAGSGGVGGTGTNIGGGGAGAGILTNGGDGGGFSGSIGHGGTAIAAGGAGGAGESGGFGGNGGFGGGGGGGGTGSTGGNGGGGGAGGFSGGGGGDGLSVGGGGGGGSFNGGINQINTAGVNTGDGVVTITFFVV
jgi:hypothetical protein